MGVVCVVQSSRAVRRARARTRASSRSSTDAMTPSCDGSAGDGRGSAGREVSRMAAPGLARRRREKSRRSRPRYTSCTVDACAPRAGTRFMLIARLAASIGGRTGAVRLRGQRQLCAQMGRQRYEGGFSKADTHASGPARNHRPRHAPASTAATERTSRRSATAGPASAAAAAPSAPRAARYAPRAWRSPAIPAPTAAR